MGSPSLLGNDLCKRRLKIPSDSMVITHVNPFAENALNLSLEVISWTRVIQRIIRWSIGLSELERTFVVQTGVLRGLHSRRKIKVRSWRNSLHGSKGVVCTTRRFCHFVRNSVWAWRFREFVVDAEWFFVGGAGCDSQCFWKLRIQTYQLRIGSKKNVWSSPLISGNILERSSFVSTLSSDDIVTFHSHIDATDSLVTCILNDEVNCLIDTQFSQLCDRLF